MNDITALMATMKAAAEKAKYAGEAPVMPFDTRITALNEFQLAACPASILALVEALEAKDKQIAELTSSESQAIAWESTTPVYIKFITDERYRKLSRKMQDWYVPYRCSHCAAGIQVIEGEA